MGKVVSAEVFLLHRKTIVLATAYGRPAQIRGHVIVKLTDENGLCGWGEATPLPKFTGETPEFVQYVLEKELISEIIGVDAADLWEARNRWNHKLPEHAAAKMALEAAFYDLAAKERKHPLYQMFGGKLREKVMINRHLGIMGIDEAVEKAVQYREQGYHSIKMKIGTDVEEDIRRVCAVRDAVGYEMKLRVDANAGYSYSDAYKFIRKTCDLDLEMYEQLLDKHDFNGIKQLKRDTGVVIGVDEAINTVQEAVRYAYERAADVFVLKLVKTGGIQNAVTISEIAASAGIRCVVTSTYDTQINGAVCLHLASSLPASTMSNDITCYATQPDMADTCHVLKDGYLTVGDEAGIGVRSLKEMKIV